MNAFVPNPLAPSPASDGRTGRALVRFEGVRKVFPARGDTASVAALDGVDLDIPEGAITGVIGRSGAGKSTLIRLVNGLERPSEGRVVVDGTDVSGLDEATLRGVRRQIGMIFQQFNLLSSRTAYGNIALPLEVAGLSRREIAARVEPLLELVGLEDKRNRYPAELSGGQKQRVGIARALATRPKVLLSDEATSALDPETTQQILRLLRKVNAELKLTVLLITHEMAVIRDVADRVAVLDDGRIIEEGPTFELFARPRHATTRSFVGSVTGATLPEWLARQLQPEPVPGGRAVLRVIFTGRNAGAPVLSQLSRRLSMDFNILQGQVDAIAGQPFGTLVISMPGDAAGVEAAQQAFAELGLGSEVLGHVA